MRLEGGLTNKDTWWFKSRRGSTKTFDDSKVEDQ